MEDDTRPEWGKKLANKIYIPQRMVLACMLLLGLINCYAMRSGLSLAISRIVVKRNTSDAEKSGAICPKEEGASYDKGGNMNWSQKEQGVVLSSFYVGYVITHLPAGMIADEYGGKWVCSLGILMTAVFTLLTPVAILKSGIWLTVFMRICVGLGQGTTFPACSNLLSKWIPKKEMSFVGSVVMGGSILGTVVSNFLTGWMLSKWDWPVIFYVYGISTCFWFLFFNIMCFNSPLDHPYISDKEKYYLHRRLVITYHQTNFNNTPWMDIFTSAPFMSMLLAGIGHDWGFLVVVSDLSKYMNDVMQFSITSNGIYSGLPFLGMYIVILLVGYATDWMITNEKIGINFSRKLNTSIGNVGPGIFMVAASYAACNRTPAIICFIMAMTLMGPYFVGIRLSPMDMSPNYSGSLMAIANGASGLVGAIVAPIVGLMTPADTLYEWRIVFWVSLIILTLSLLPYLVYGSSEVQPWNEGSVRNKEGT